MKYQKPGITAVNIPVNMSRDSDERSSRIALQIRQFKELFYSIRLTVI